MPATDCLTPPGLSPKAKEILKSYGGWTMFMLSYGLKPWDFDDAEEGERILKALAQADDDVDDDTETH